MRLEDFSEKKILQIVVFSLLVIMLATILVVLLIKYPQLSIGV